MSNKVIRITDEEWEEKYKPIRNHFNPTASEYDSEYTMFETYGQELKFVMNTDPAYVWTEVDGDDGGVYIVNGYYLVNRIGYYITAKPHNPDDFIELCIISPEEEDALQGECEDLGHTWTFYSLTHPDRDPYRVCTRCGEQEEEND